MTNTPSAPEERTLALAHLVANLGNIAKTSRESGVPETTLRRWKEEYSEAYRDMELRYSTEIEQEILQRARANAREAGVLVEQAIDKAKKDLETRTLSAVDLGRLARDMSQVHSQNVDKVLTLTGRPAVITESRELVALVKSLEADGVLTVKQAETVEGTAEEIEPGEQRG